jgi:hypothetical protein
VRKHENRAFPASFQKCPVVWLLKVKKDNPIFGIKDGFTVVLDFYFEDEKFVWFGWKEDPTEEESLSTAGYLYDLWKVSSALQFSALPIKSFAKTLGFQPSISIWPSKFAVETEKLPGNMLQWLESTADATTFLDKIGVQTIDSAVVKLRRFFTHEDIDFTEHDLTRAFDADEAEHILLLTNTLLFLMGKVFKEEKHLNMLKAIFELLPFSDNENNIPTLCVHSVSATGGLSYHLLLEFPSLAGFNAIILDSLGKVGISVTKFLDFCEEKNLLLFNKDLYPSTWHALPDYQIEVSDPLPDWETIHAGSIEWDAPYYLAWKTETRPTIFMYDGSLPELVFCYPIEAEPIIKLNQADFLFGENQIYLDKSKDVINALIAATNSGVINPKDLGDFYTLQTKPAAIEGYSVDPNFPGTSGDFDPRNQMPQWTHLESEHQKEINDEAKRLAAEWLRQKGYEVPEPLLTNYYRLLGIRNTEGQAVQVHVRSAKGGNLFLSPTDWSELGVSGALLLVVLPSGKISSITFDDLMRSNGRINLQFDAQTFNPEGLMIFAKIFHYVPGVKFVIQAPNFSASDYIKEFGLYKRVQESIKSAPTNLID